MQIYDTCFNIANNYLQLSLGKTINNSLLTTDYNNNNSNTLINKKRTTSINNNNSVKVEQNLVNENINVKSESNSRSKRTRGS